MKCNYDGLEGPSVRLVVKRTRGVADALIGLMLLLPHGQGLELHLELVALVVVVGRDSGAEVGHHGQV